MRQALLSTKDNPFDPFTQEDDWRRFDFDHGYNCDGLMAKFAKTSDQLSEVDELRQIEEGIDTILRLHNYEIYKKVVKEDESDEENSVKQNES